jgi:hypothetical protein
MPDWIGISTKVLGPLAQRIFRRWLFEAELLSATRVIYIYANGNSP